MIASVWQLQMALNQDTVHVLALKWKASAKLITSADVTQRCFCVELMTDAALLHAIRDMIRRVMLVCFIDRASVVITLTVALLNALVAYISFAKLLGSPFYAWVPSAAVWLCIFAAIPTMLLFRFWHNSWKWRVLKTEDLIS